MKKFILYLFLVSTVFFLISTTAAAADQIKLSEYPKGTIIAHGSALTVMSLLSLIQSILLKVMLPMVLIGSSIYIAYELFTAEGDETKMKKAWKSVAFSAVGIISIAVSYAFVKVISTLSI